MSLRNHLDQWLHPRDPLLEAWKDDPFVEAMVAREKRRRWGVGTLVLSFLLQRWGCLSVFAATSTLFAIVVITRRSIYADEALVAFVACFLFVLLIRQALVILRRLFLRNASTKASLLLLLHARGSNPLILDLWMSGVRGRDMMKAMHAILCRRPMRKGLWIFGAFLVVPILGWEPLSRVGLAGLLTYVLLAVWFRLIFVYFRYGNLNPLYSVIDRYPGAPPRFVGSALEAGASADPSGSREITPGASGFFVLIALIFPMVYGNLPSEPRPFGPWGLFGAQLVSLMIANYIMLAHRLEPGAYFHERLEDALHIADLEFDRYVRELIIEDPDAGR